MTVVRYDVRPPRTLVIARDMPSTTAIALA
jgi:hypothetical protein